MQVHLTAMRHEAAYTQDTQIQLNYNILKVRYNSGCSVKYIENGESIRDANADCAATYFTFLFGGIFVRINKFMQVFYSIAAQLINVAKNSSIDTACLPYKEQRDLERRPIYMSGKIQIY